MGLKNSFTLDFIGIGAMKCGTSWVSKCLEEHPEIQFSSEKSVKELHFFSSNNSDTVKTHGPSNYSRGLSWYGKQFPKPLDGKIIGEYSNSYFTDPLAPERIKKAFPNIKLILTLRNPSDMSYSLYWWIKASLKDPFGKKSYLEAFKTYSWYKEVGLYSKYLNTYLNVFDSSKIHIIFFEDIKSKPKNVSRELYRFLELNNTSFTPSIIGKPVRESIAKRSSALSSIIKAPTLLLKNLNSKLYWDIANNKYLYSAYKVLNNKPYKYPKMSDSDRKFVVHYYKSDIKKLETLTARNLESWYSL